MLAFSIMKKRDIQSATSQPSFGDEEAIQALKAMHEKYVQVKRQLLYISKEHEVVLQELEASTQQGEEYRAKYENIVKLYNELRNRFVSQMKEQSLTVEELQQENNRLHERLNNHKTDEDPFAVQVESFDDDELKQVLKLIMQVEERLKNQGGRIPELTSAIAELIRRAIIVQNVVISKESAEERREWYCENTYGPRA